MTTSHRFRNTNWEGLTVPTTGVPEDQHYICEMTQDVYWLDIGCEVQRGDEVLALPSRDGGMTSATPGVVTGVDLNDGILPFRVEIDPVNGVAYWVTRVIPLNLPPLAVPPLPTAADAAQFLEELAATTRVRRTQNRAGLKSADLEVVIVDAT